MTVNKYGDDDLKDLIGSSQGGGNDDKSQMKPLNLEHLSQGELDVPVTHKSRNHNNNNGFSLLRLCGAYASYICDYAPKCCWAMGIFALLVPTYLLIVAVFFNSTEYFGVVNDFTNVNSEYDLTLGKIDHWCLKGGDDGCRCEDPLQPQSRGEFRMWSKAQVANKALVSKLIEQGETTPDIAFLGASIIAEMGGKWFGNAGNKTDDDLKGLKTLFDKNFKKSEGGELDAVALGLAGDTSPTILWRLMNGEMPPAFNPKIWWLEVGLNDLGRTLCSEEVVILGVLRVVEEILSHKKNARVVINSLFPLADLRGGVRPGQADFKDSFDKNLRQRPTKMIEKQHAHELMKANKANRKHGGVKRQRQFNNGGQTDHGDSTVVLGKVPNKERDQKRGKAAKKGGGGGGFRDGNGQRFLTSATSNGQENRQLWFGNNKNKKKTIQMKAHKDRQRKYNAVTHKERKLPLWTAISAINAELKKFAAKHERVSFFDATDIFTDREDANMYTLKTNMISVRGHPTRAGFVKWENQVVSRAKTLLALSEGEQ